MEVLVQKLNGKTWEKNGMARIYFNNKNFDGAKVFLENGKLIIENPYNRVAENTLWNHFNNFQFDEICAIFEEAGFKPIHTGISDDRKTVFELKSI